ncbi:MAG: exo-alpha-sialidase [Lewinellaceae bacterium]|nr:exo-alpha-sialidase [Lewinellaceae bacterium]
MSCKHNSGHGDSNGLLIKAIPVPTKESGEPNLFVSSDGGVLLSWVEYLNDTTDALLFSRLENGKWSEPNEIARGSDWFVNWADFPSLASFHNKPNSVAAHWLQKSANGTYDYDVRIALSKDGGYHWGPSFIPHRDGIAAEHGFVTMFPLQDGRMFIVWLDGRNTKGSEGHEDAHAHGGAMALRTAEFDEDGNLYEEAELDTRVCDCCQTDAVLIDSGPVVVYRDRSEEEVRDISIVRKINGQWTAPQKVHEDNWKIAGCPVNGPAITAQNNTIAVAWFSMPGEKPQVKVTFSEDSGETFSAPIRVDEGNPVGRVDIELLNSNEAVVSWMEEKEDGATINAVKVDLQGKMGAPFLMAATNPSRQSGFPVMAKRDKQIIFAWTDADSLSSVKTVIMNIE